MNRRPARRLAPTGIALAVAAVLLQAGAVWAAVSFQSDGSLGLGLRSTDNVRLASGVGEDQPAGDTALFLAPSLTAEMLAGADRLRLSYDGEYVRYREGTYDPVWIHHLLGDLEFRRLAPFFLTLRERRESLPRDPDRPEEDTEDYLDHNLLSLQAGMSWDPSATSRLELSYLESEESFPGEPEADKMNSRGGQFLWEKRWTPLWRNSLSAQWRRIDRETGEDYRSLSVRVAGFHRLAPRRDLDYALGWEDRLYGRSGASGFWTAGVGFTRRLDRGGRQTVRYDDWLEDRYDGETVRNARAYALWTEVFHDGSSVTGSVSYGRRSLAETGRKENYWGPSADFHWMLAPRLALDLTGFWFARRLNEEGQSSRDDLLLGEAALVVYLGSHLVMEGGYGRLDERAGNSEDSFRDNHLWLMVTAAFKRIVPGETLRFMRRLRRSNDYLGGR